MQGEGAVTPQETEPDLPASVGGSPEEAGAAVAHHGHKDSGSRSSGKYSLVWALPDSTVRPTKEPVGSSAGCLRPNNQQGGNSAPPINRQAD